MAAAREAGEMLRENRMNLNVETKADGSLVTNVDRESERLITARIKAAFPDHGIAGEESGTSDGGAEYLWVIDPLDGTHNYIRGIDVYGVSIGVWHGGAFTAGVIYMPTEDALYAAERGAGAYRNSGRISVSRHSTLASCSLGLDSDMRKEVGRKLHVIGLLGGRAFNLRMFGSSARMLTYLAEGKLDGLLEFDDKPWDFAAGLVIVEEAGGRVTTMGGRPVPYKAGDYAASNGLIHDELLSIVSP